MSDMLPLEVDQKEASSDINSQLDGLLGHEFQIGDKRFRLVQANVTSSVSSAGAKTWKWSSRSAWTVTPTTAKTDVVAGVSDENLGQIDDDDYFLVQTDGRAEVTQGDDSGNRVTAGELVIPDDDTDEGKVITSGSSFTAGVSFARAIDTATSTDEVVTVEILGPLE